MKKMLGITTAALLAVSVDGRSAVLEFAAVLDPRHETPPVVAPGATGSAFVLYDDLTGDLSWNIAFEGLSDGATRAHIHQAPAGSPGPVEIDLAAGVEGGILDGVGDTTGIFAGATVIGDDPSSAAGPLGLVSALLAGDLYINIHTDAHPGGEIRGQILPGSVTVVPLPAALGLLAPALGLLALARPRASGRA